MDLKKSSKKDKEKETLSVKHHKLITGPSKDWSFGKEGWTLIVPPTRRLVRESGNNPDELARVRRPIGPEERPQGIVT